MGSSILLSKRGCCQTCTNVADKDCDINFNEAEKRIICKKITGDEDDGRLDFSDPEETLLQTKQWRSFNIRQPQGTFEKTRRNRDPKTKYEERKSHLITRVSTLQQLTSGYHEV